MRKRFLLLALVLVVIVGLLSAATYVTVSNHATLHGEGASGHTSGVVALMGGAVPPPGMRTPPAGTLVGTLTLHGDGPTPKPGTVNPNAPLSGGGWTCSIWQYAFKANSTTMAGYATYDCSGSPFSISFDQYADYCSPLLWGCTWQNAKKTFPGCDYINPVSGACPQGLGYNYVFNIPGGQLWRERSYVCASKPGTTSDCGTIQVQVQF